MPRQPNLFIVGAPKCGTTSLARWLGSHPDVFLPSVKEPHHYNTDEAHVNYASREDYLELYASGQDHRYRLDASVWYLHSKEAVHGILNDCPEAKLIVCLRNPVDMAFSLHGQFLYKTGRETVTGFRKAWDLSDERLNGRKLSSLASEHRHLAYKYSCRIGTQAERLVNIAGSSKVKLVVLDDLIQYPDKTLSSILKFLDLSVSVPLYLPHDNPRLEMKVPALRRILVRGAKFKKMIGIDVGFGIGKRAIRWIGYEGDNSKINEYDRVIVTRYFINEIKKIWELTGFRYEKWIFCLDHKDGL